jgi:arsenate reductase
MDRARPSDAPALYIPRGDWFTRPMTDFPITIFHNPKCGTSRNVLAMIRAAGYAPSVVEYLKTPWTRQQLAELMAQGGVRPHEWLRVKGTPAQALGLTAPDVSDDAILDAMVAEPILVERPIVVSPKGVRLCRPSERVFDLLEAVPESFTKEDGEVVRPRG